MLAYTTKFKPMNAVVRVAIRALLAMAVLAVVIASVCFSWFYFYSGDIPHFSELAELAPDSAATVPDRCSGTSIPVIPPRLSARTCVMRSALRKVRMMGFWPCKSRATCCAIRK